MTGQPDDMPPWRHIEKAERLLASVEDVVSANYQLQTGESKTDVLLAAITHALIAQAKMTEGDYR